MSKNKFTNWLRDMFNLGMVISNDVHIDIAKANYQKYQDDLKRKREEYLKALCQEIKIVSRGGLTYITTANLKEEWMTYEFLMEMKDYFEQRGFNVKEEHNYYGVLTSWLKISWE